MNKTEIVGSGLINMGNTCFFNATLQCLLHSTSLSRDLTSKRHSQNCHFDQWCVYCELQDTWSKTKTSKTFEPRKLVHNLKKLFKKFKLGRQEDSHQFLRYFIEGIQKSDIGSKEKNAEKIRILTENSKIFSIFGGLMKSTIECESCHHKSQILEHSYDLSLECQRSNSIQESLGNYFRVDHLTGQNKYKCSSCNKLVNAKKYFSFNKLPQVLTIQLKRFTNNLHKLSKFVQFTESLQLQKQCQSKTPTLYRLSGIVVHAGSTSFSGHYYSYNRVGANWYKMDDSHVAKVERETVFNQKAYLLFYEKVQANKEIKEQHKQTVVQKQQTKKQPQGKKKTFFDQIQQNIVKIHNKQKEQEQLNRPQENAKQKVRVQQKKQVVVKSQKKEEVLEEPPLQRSSSQRSGHSGPSVHLHRSGSLQRLRNFNSKYFLKKLIQQIVIHGNQYQQ